MNKKLIKFSSFVIYVLTSALVSRYVFKYGVEFKPNLHPMIKTWIGMAIIVIAFIPVSYFNKPIEKATKKFLDHSQKIAEKKNGGIIWGLLLALIVLFFLYAFLWYELTPGEILIHHVDVVD